MAISFSCPNCGNKFSVSRNLAGRDGWCKVCKRWVIVPDGSSESSPMAELTLKEKYERLEGLLKFAATKADNLKKLLSKYCDEDGELVPIDTVHFRRDKRDKLYSRLAFSMKAIAQMQSASSEVIRQRDDAQAGCNEFRIEVKRLKQELISAKSRIDTLCKEVEGLGDADRASEERARELAVVEQQYAALLENNTKIEADRERLRAELDCTREVSREVESELRTENREPGESDRSRETDTVKLVPSFDGLFSTGYMKTSEMDLLSVLSDAKASDLIDDDPIVNSYLRFLESEEENASEANVAEAEE